MMTKIHHADAQEELYKLCGGYMQTLIDTNSRVKSASSEVITREIMDRYAPDKDHFAIHCIAMGDGETYGQNRNGDFWPKLANISRHQTFVTHGAYYREHRHRSRDLSIGSVKYAAYNPVMHRIELVVHGNIKKAEDIYESLKKGEQRSDSMSARVPYDECSCCCKKAKGPKNYCDHLRYYMNQWMPEFKKYAYAINEHPTYFDISDVKFPADRIAHYLETRFPENEEMSKAASAGSLVVPGWEWAEFEGASLPQEVGLELSTWDQHLLTKFAARESWLEKSANENSPELEYLRFVTPNAFTADLTDEQLSAVRTMRPTSFFGELAKRASILPFRSFLAYVTNRTLQEVDADPATKNAAAVLPTVFNRLLNDGCGCDNDAIDLFQGGTPGVITLDRGLTDEAESAIKFASQIGEVTKNAMNYRVILVENPQPKPLVKNASAADDKKAEFYAGLYGLYKVAAYRDMLSSRDDVNEIQQTVLTAHNLYV